MKKIFKSFISFSRTERNGLMALCVLLIILIAIRFTMHLWIHPNVNKEQEQQMVRAWEKFKQTQAQTKDSITKATALPLDINTADSLSLLHLKGIGPSTAGKIITYRKKQPFTNINELKGLGHFSDAVFDTLKKQLIVN